MNSIANEMLDFLESLQSFRVSQYDHCADKFEIAVNNDEGLGDVYSGVTLRHAIYEAMKDECPSGREPWKLRNKTK